MRFLLLEKVPQITSDEIKKWNSASDKVRGQMATDILQRYEQPSAMNMWQPFRRSLKLFGIDPKDNPFIKFTDDLVSKVPLKKTDDDLFNILVDMHQQRLIDLNHSYLIDPRLYDRSPEEFQYTVNVFETVLDPSRLNRYFKNTSKISVDQLYDKGIIKPAGNESTADNLNTIFGTVESWSGTNSENDKPQEKKHKEIKLSDAQKDRILKHNSYESTKHVTNPVEGEIIYARGTADASKQYNWSDTSEMTQGSGYYRYTGGQWVPIASA